MSFAIMRCKKLKGMGSVASSLQHCYRERETKNADAEKTPNNQHYVAGNTDEAMGNLRERLPEKYRKDAVLAVEYMMTTSPDWWEKASSQQQAQFFAKSVEWLSEKYGKEGKLDAALLDARTYKNISHGIVEKIKNTRAEAIPSVLDAMDKRLREMDGQTVKIPAKEQERGR